MNISKQDALEIRVKIRVIQEELYKLVAQIRTQADCLTKDDNDSLNAIVRLGDKLGKMKERIRKAEKKETEK